MSDSNKDFKAQEQDDQTGVEETKQAQNELQTRPEIKPLTEEVPDVYKISDPNDIPDLPLPVQDQLVPN